MGECPIGKFPGRHGGSRKRWLQADFRKEIVQEIEILFGRQSIVDLDSEAVKMAARHQALHLAVRAPGTTAERQYPRSCRVRNCLAARADRQSNMTVVITVSNARAVSAQGTSAGTGIIFTDLLEREGRKRHLRPALQQAQRSLWERRSDQGKAPA